MNLPVWAQFVGSGMGILATIAAPIWAYRASSNTSRVGEGANRNVETNNLIQRLQEERAADRTEHAREMEAARTEHAARMTEVKDTLRETQALNDVLIRRMHAMSDYISTLRAHIEDGDDPPPPPYPEGLR